MLKVSSFLAPFFFALLLNSKYYLSKHYPPPPACFWQVPFCYIYGSKSVHHSNLFTFLYQPFQKKKWHKCGISWYNAVIEGEIGFARETRFGSLAFFQFHTCGAASLVGTGCAADEGKAGGIQLGSGLCWCAAAVILRFTYF